MCASFDHSFGGTLHVHAWATFASLFGRYEHAHGLSVARELECKLFRVLLSDHIVAAHGFVLWRERGFVGAEYVHFLDEDGQSGLGGLTNLFVDLLALVVIQ